MKTTAMILLLGVLLFTTNCFAASASFSWLPNTETDLAGYNIHYGDTTSEYDTVIDVGLPGLVDGRVVATLTDVPDNLSYYVATAYDTEGLESDYSAEVEYNPAPDAPGDMQINVTVTVTINQ